jgi:hypothetical protein
MKREGIDADQIRAAIERAEEGLVDADLGGGVIKQRIARRGEGRSGGYRTIIAFKRENGLCSCTDLQRAIRRTFRD